MQRRKVSGVLLLDKPTGLSSNTALQVAKRLYRAEKAGHAGTLDPLASGLLPILFGEATRFSAYLLDADKRYLAEVALGATTETGDAEGAVLLRRPVEVSPERLAQVLARFTGMQTQVPPMYSAIKRDGTPLYVLARRGETVERTARQIEIKSLNAIKFSGERLTLDVLCSKGTYIRTLAEDIGEALGCGAHLAGLRRTAAGALDLSAAQTLAALETLSEEARDGLLIPAESLLEGLPRLDLDPERTRLFLHGQTLALAGESATPGVCRIYGVDGRFLGLADAVEGRLKPRRLMPTAEQGPKDAPTG